MKISQLDLSKLKTFVVPVLILVTIVLMIPFAFIPLLNNVRDTNDSLKSEQERLDKLAVKLEVLDSLDENDINDKLSISEQVLPVGKSLASLVVGIQNLAVSNKLAVEGITLNPGGVATNSADVSSSGETDDNSLVLELTLTGKIASVQKFLDKLQVAKRLIFTEEANLTSDDQTKEYQVKFFLKTPFRPVTQSSSDAPLEILPLLSEANLKTLDLVKGFTNVTNISITEVRTGVVKDPFSGK